MTLDTDKLVNFRPPDKWQKITTLDAHTEGEPLRIIVDGLPELRGNTVLEKRKYMRDNYDALRKALMWEPRGHADMYGAVLTEPFSEGADFGAFFLHNEGYSTMCGHAIIALTHVAVNYGLVSKTEPLTTVGIDSPAGLVTAFAEIRNGRISKIYFHNVPSFVFKSGESISVPGIGDVRFDIAFGGAFYAFVNADELGISMGEDNYSELIEKGMMIKRAVMNKHSIVHPFESELNFLYGTIFYGKPESTDADSRNVCIFAEGEVDRSPTGTGVSARMALHFAKGEIEFGEEMIIESIIGTRFSGKVSKVEEFGGYPAVIPEVSGTAFITGKNEFYIDPADPLRNGFILR